jgi:hypothetical protein
MKQYTYWNIPLVLTSFVINEKEDNVIPTRVGQGDDATLVSAEEIAWIVVV